MGVMIKSDMCGSSVCVNLINSLWRNIFSFHNRQYVVFYNVHTFVGIKYVWLCSWKYFVIQRELRYLEMQF